MKKVLIIYTGGTIGMQSGPRGSLQPFNFDKVIDSIPELNRLACTISHYSFPKPIDSSNARADLWVGLCRVIEEHYRTTDGFIVLHGTDTMAYSASALSFMLQNLSKPVIFTGSQLPLGAIRTDARRNIITSIEIIAKGPLIPEVCIFFNNQLFRANRAEKFTSASFDAFQSLNYPVLAESGVEIHYNAQSFLPMPKSKKLLVFDQLDSRIGLIRLFPGISREWLEAILSLKGLKGLVMETYGSGNAPTYPDFLQPLKKAVQKGLIVLNVSQCSGGKVEQGKYETSHYLEEMGVISGHDMTTEAALTKLMVLLGRYPGERKKVLAHLRKSISGEISL